jgi:tripartite-type tricarboxylate transporter receptor subunit TctC
MIGRCSTPVSSRRKINDLREETMGTRRDVVKLLAGAVIGASLAAPALAAGDTLPETMDKPGGFPERPLAMIVPYGPAGGSGQVAQAMIQGVKDATGIDTTPDYKPGGSGMVGLKTYMAAPADGYTVLEHIDDATSAFAIGKSNIHPANDLIPLVISQITFSQIYIRVNEDRFTDWDSYVAYVKSQGGKSTIANVSGEGSMERINMNRIADHFGMKLQQISFDKGAPRYGALKGGQVDALFEQPGDVRNFLESGDFKPILTLLKERPAAFPDAPSMTDVGLDFTAQGCASGPRSLSAVGLPEGFLFRQLPGIQQEEVHGSHSKLPRYGRRQGPDRRHHGDLQGDL